MEWNAVEGSWKQVSAAIKQKWGAVTDEDLQFVDKNKDGVLAKVRARTGLESATAERQLDTLIANLVPAEGAAPKAATPIVPPPGAKPSSQG